MALIVEKRIPTTDRGETVLVCPRCGGESLHHQAVTSYDRGEDAELVIRSVQEDGSAKIEAVSSDGSGNPSSRRAGLSIKSWCKGCKGVDEDTLELTVGAEASRLLTRSSAASRPNFSFRRGVYRGYDNRLVWSMFRIGEPQS